MERRFDAEEKYPLVQVLVSTYNGEKYLREQIESLLHQTYPRVGILVRDDGSSDGTADLLKAYEAKGLIRCIFGKNTGVISSFFTLLQEADNAAEYFAFCDQDDVWLPEKLEKAIKALSGCGSEGPLLYCGTPGLADEDLIPLKRRIPWKIRRISFGNALVQNICTGCTAVFDRKLRDLAAQQKPSDAVMHDWWLYLVASCFGHVIYDENVPILYRQHGDNASDTLVTRKQLVLYRFKRILEGGGKIFPQIRDFNKIYAGQMSMRQKYLVRMLLKAERPGWNRLRAVFSRQCYRQKISDDIIYRFAMLIGRL